MHCTLEALEILEAAEAWHLNPSLQIWAFELQIEVLGLTIERSRCCVKDGSTHEIRDVASSPSFPTCVKVAVLDPSRSFRVGECQVALDDIKPAAWLRHVETI